MIVLEYGKKNKHRRWTYICQFCESKLQFDDDDKDVLINKYSLGGKSQTQIEGKCPVCKTSFKLQAEPPAISPGLVESAVWK